MMNKGALNLLSDYGDNSSDDEVPGPRVSTKRVHKDDYEEKSKKFKRLPVPNALLESKNAATEHIDEPDLHDGRIRSFAHERGNWATYVYIPFENHEGIEELISTICYKASKNMETMCNKASKNMDIKRVDSFHISLTKTVILKHHWINAFTESVKLNISHFKKFMVLFEGIKVYCNDERTRTFIGLQIKTGYSSLKSLVESLDKCLGEFNLPPFYEDPSFHVSIAWCVGDFEEELNLILRQLDDHLQDIVESYSMEHWYIYVKYVLCKTGNKHFQFYLD